MNSKCFGTLLAAAMSCSISANAQPTQKLLTREQWGARRIDVKHTNDQWVIADKRRTVILNDADLALEVRAGTVVWKMVPSGANDMRVKSAGKEFQVRLADRHSTGAERYDTGFKTGVKLALTDWGPGNALLGLSLSLGVVL